MSETITPREQEIRNLPRQDYNASDVEYLLRLLDAERAKVAGAWDRGLVSGVSFAIRARLDPDAWEPTNPHRSPLADQPIQQPEAAYDLDNAIAEANREAERFRRFAEIPGRRVAYEKDAADKAKFLAGLQAIKDARARLFEQTDDVTGFDEQT